VKRHEGCSEHKPPSYYLGYGLKYCKRFSTELYPTLGIEGKIWLPKTRLLLQQSMEQGLSKANGKMSATYTNKNNPIANELNDEEFKDFALNTHIKSYWEGGFRHISHTDIEKVAGTLGLREWKDPETWETGWPLGVGYTTNYLEQHISNTEQRKEIYEICKKVTGANQEVCTPE
jgi:hypothetical protein